MSDESTYGFNKPDATSLMQMIHTGDAEFPEMRPRGRGGDQSIQFTIDSIRTADSEVAAEAPYTGLVIATVTVKVASCNLASLIGEQVDVVDHSGCVFDLDEGELEGLWGWATKRVAESLDPEAEEGDLTPCHWSADDRCCE